VVIRSLASLACMEALSAMAVYLSTPIETIFAEFRKIVRRGGQSDLHRLQSDAVAQYLRSAAIQRD
jgi:hypothetical protein